MQAPERKPLCGSRFRRLLSIFNCFCSFRPCSRLKTSSPSSRFVTQYSLAECAESAFSKSRSVSPVGSVGASAAHSRQRSPPETRTPRRAQNLLAGCIFDGLACQKCFCVTLDKSNRTEDEQVCEIGGI